MSSATTVANPASASDASGSLASVLADTGINELLLEFDRDLIGLKPVKTRIREIAALLLVDRLRRERGFTAGGPSLHMCFTGNPGTGKTTVAVRMATILHRLGYVRKGHLVAVTRDDLVGQYIGHTAPKTKEVLKKAMGGVLFIDEAYYLYRPENERDYGQEAIEILLQVMEDNRDDLVVILAGYRDRMDRFFESNPGMSSRIAHHSQGHAWNQAHGTEERIGQLLLLHGKDQEPIGELKAGEIGAVAKLSVTSTGDALSSKEKPFTLPALTFPQPTLVMAIEPQTKTDLDKMGPALQRMLDAMHYRFDVESRMVFDDYLKRRMAQPHFANARSVRNALDRARLRHAYRLYSHPEVATTDESLTTIAAADLLASRVFSDGDPR